MIRQRSRVFLSLAVAATLLLAVPSEAGKRRAVHHPANAVAHLEGTVLDSVTSQPVVNARITADGKTDRTDAAGKFTLRNLDFAGTIPLTVERSGYSPKSVTLTQGASTITIRVDPLPTTTLKRSNGSTITVDTDSVEFGYVMVFAGYQKDRFDDFCKGGQQVRIDRDEMKKITGPGVVGGENPCCPGSPALKVNLTLRTGETTDVFFMDSCDKGPTDIDVIARNHVTGEFEFIHFTDISEVVFP